MFEFLRGDAQGMKQHVISSAKKAILFLPHAIQQMSKPDRMITTDEIRRVVMSGDIIEQYPEDKRGVSCLVSFVTQNRAIHVVCAPKPEYLAIITAYLPTRDQWSLDYKFRK